MSRQAIELQRALRALDAVPRVSPNGRTYTALELTHAAIALLDAHNDRKKSPKHANRTRRQKSPRQRGGRRRGSSRRLRL
jgi:hypothetical protein